MIFSDAVWAVVCDGPAGTTGPTGAYFWATHTGAELDLLLMKGSRRYPGDQRYTLDRHITVAPLAHLAADPGVITPTTRGRRP